MIGSATCFFSSWILNISRAKSIHPRLVKEIRLQAFEIVHDDGDGRNGLSLARGSFLMDQCIDVRNRIRTSAKKRDDHADGGFITALLEGRDEVENDDELTDAEKRKRALKTFMKMQADKAFSSSGSSDPDGDERDDARTCSSADGSEQDQVSDDDKSSECSNPNAKDEKKAEAASASSHTLVSAVDRNLPGHNTVDFDGIEYVMLNRTRNGSKETYGFSIRCELCSFSKNCPYISMAGRELMSESECRRRLVQWRNVPCGADREFHRTAGSALLSNFAL